MRLRQKFIVIFLFWSFFSGCSVENVEAGPKKAVSSFHENAISLQGPLILELAGDSSNIEVYTWDRNEIKFEQTSKVRGIQKKELLEKELKDFHVDIREKEGRIRFEYRYNGSIKSLADRSLDLRIHIPKKASSMYYKLDTGTIKFFDDIRCDLNLELNRVNVNINRLEGRLQAQGNMCTLIMENGRLRSQSKISNKMGNINIQAEFEEKGSYSFATQVGNVELMLPDNSHVSIECLGLTEKNEFTAFAFPTKIRVSTGMGKISVGKY